MSYFIRALAAKALLISCLFGSTLSAHATIVRIETSLGDIDVNLFDDDTPLTVANFLNYVDDGLYDGTFIHRSIPDFIIQGGGFSYEGVNSNDLFTIDSVTVFPAVTNEPKFSNRRGTIAMAKIGGDPDSATSQWFFNLSDNSDLDGENGGFTVFGQVITGMSTVDAIAGLDRFNFGRPINILPLRDFSMADLTSDVNPDESNFVEVERVTVIDDAMDTAADLNPIENMIINDSDNDDGGGSTTPLLLAILGVLVLFRRRLNI